MSATTSIPPDIVETVPSRRADQLTSSSSSDDAEPTIAPTVAPLLAGQDGQHTIAPPTAAYVPGSELVPGTKLGTRYTVLRLLGRGGMGAVYQAYDDELGVAVAIKTILPAPSTDERTRRDQVSRFKSELLLARQVTHKNVVRIHDIGEVEDLKYITMSFVAGETLGALIARLGAMSVTQALALARQIADGMAAAHEVGVVHRDLKPENVMVTPEGQALIMDFGIASDGAAEGGAIVGTLSYMAPEQAVGKPVDARADIYAFGLILYDMLLGRQRLKQYKTPIEELQTRLEGTPPAVRSIRADVPAPLDAIVSTATEPLAKSRFADTRALQTALSALADDGELRPVERPKARWPSMVAGVIATALAMTGVWWWVTPAPVVEKAPVSVLIADFENRTGDAVFDGVVEQALGLGIESASFVTAYPRRDALRVAAAIKQGAKLDEPTARLVALREGVNVLVAGAVEPSARGFRISARVLQGGNEQSAEMASLSVEAADRNAVLEAVGRLAGEVREALGDTDISSGGPAAGETFTAASLEAAAAYAKAQELQIAGKVEEAIAQYQETLRLDPEMGRAYSGVAAQYSNLARTADAETNYQQALARLDRMTDREKLRTRGSYYLFARKPDQAAQEFTALVKAYPADTTGLTNLALSSFYQRDMIQALEQGRRAAAIFPRNVLRRANVALYAMYAGRFEDAISEANAVHELNPTHLKAFVARALSLLALDRVDEANAVYDQLSKTGPAGESFAWAGRADLAHYQGRLDDAAKMLVPAIEADLARENVTAAAAKRLALAELRLEQGDPPAAAQAAAAAVASVDSDIIRFGAGVVLAAAGRTAQAELLAGTLATRLEADPQAYGRLVLAEMALTRKDARKAVEYAREAQKFSDTWPGRVILGRAYLGVNAFPEAYAELEAALKRKGEAAAVFLDDVPSYRRLAPVHYYLGLAQEGLKSRAALASFRTFGAIKKNGDEQGLVSDVRRRLKNTS